MVSTLIRRCALDTTLTNGSNVRHVNKRNYALVLVPAALLAAAPVLVELLPAPEDVVAPLDVTTLVLLPLLFVVLLLVAPPLLLFPLLLLPVVFFRIAASRISTKSLNFRNIFSER